MTMDYLSWFVCAVAVFWLGWVTYRVTVQGAVAGRWCTKSEASTLARRLTDCETLQLELVQALSRIEARDKMRAVRAARKDSVTPAEPIPEVNQDQPGKLTTAELRRRIAMGRT